MRKLLTLTGINLLWLPLSMLSDGINSLVLPAFILQRTNQAGQASALGLVTFVGLVIGMLVQPLAGAASDQFKPRWGRLGVIAAGVFSTVAALAVFGFSRDLTGLFAGYILIQVTMNVIQAAQQGLLPDLVSPKQRGSASGVKIFFDVGGAMLGFVLLGQILGSGRSEWAVLILALILSAAFLATLLLIREPRQGVPVTAEAMRSTELRSFTRMFHREPGWSQAFLRLVLSRFFFLLGTYGVGRFLLFFVADRLNINPNHAAEQAGSLLASLSVITILAALPAGWAADRWGRLPLMIMGAALSGAGTLLLILAHSSLTILLFGAMMALGSAAFSPANWANTSDLVPPNAAASYLGVANLGTAGAAAAAGLFGFLIDWGNRFSSGSGYPVLFGASTFAFLLSILVLRGSGQPSEAGERETSS